MPHQHPHAVLIVDDERIVAKDLQQTVTSLGYDGYAVASSSDEAMARASERCPDVVLMDIRIKGQRDGIETASLLRERFGVPVVYLTAHADESTVERAKLTEPYGYLLKPVRSAELRTAIEMAVYRARMERRLRERERWYATTLGSISDAVIAVDLAGKVTLMNRAAESLTGIKAEQALARPVRDILRLFDRPAGTRIDQPLDLVLRERRSFEVAEMTLEHPEKGSLLISDAAAPVVDHGEMLGAVMVFRDVTTQKKLERQLELADRLSSLGTMAAGVAHELNNPLAIVMGNVDVSIERLQGLRADLAARGDVTLAGTVRLLEEIVDAERDSQSATARMARIVADLRLFSRPPSLGDDTASLPAAVDWALRSTASEFRHRARVTVDIPANIPPVNVHDTRLGQVLVNLLVNAAQSITPGEPDRNAVKITARSKAPNRVVIEVRDSGCGMPPEVLKRVFEPFYTTKPVGVGTGLGLSVCHGIVTSLGGTLEVESQVGVGTCFRVTLPAAGTDVDAPKAPREERDRPRARRKRLLIVDDEATLLGVMRRALREHELVCIDDPREALKLLETGERFDVIISDLTMPGVSGIDIYERLLSRRPVDARRMIFMTGGTLSDRARDFLASVSNTVLEKPFSMDELRGAIAATCREVRSERDTSAQQQHGQRARDQ